MTKLGAWRELKRETIADCRIFQVERSTAESPLDGSSHDYYRVVSRDWVQIVPITPAQEVVMVRQYRHGASQFILEIPGGLIEPGEDPAVGAARECLEESGYRVTNLCSLGFMNPNPAIHSHRLHSFYAHDAVRVAEIQNSATEQTEVELVPVDRLGAYLREGRIDHCLVAATLWRFLAGHSLPDPAKL